MKFVADGMLGKLTRWLRMLGHDVKYSTDANDELLMTIAKKDHRILLTRDLQLYQRATARGVKAFYLEGQTREQKLAELASRFNIELDMDMSTSRCPRCNTKVKPVPKEKVADKVEKNTFARYDEYWKCPKCNQIYWQGSHWTKIRNMLKTAKGHLKENRKKASLSPKATSKEYLGKYHPAESA